MTVRVCHKSLYFFIDFNASVSIGPAELRNIPNISYDRPISEERKEKLRQLKLGKPGPNKGIPKSEETKRKISESLMGRKGAKRSEETKKRIGDAKRGNKIWLGKKHKPETIEKMKLARQKYWDRKKQVV